MPTTDPARLRRRRRARLHPAQVVVAGFAGVIMLGALLLTLPVSAASGTATDFDDAVFTATSAVCVTGLVTLDTATHWSGFGLTVIMLLIQVGGLGIMIVATLIGVLLARRLSVRSRLNAAAETTAIGRDDVRRVVKGIVLTSFSIEAVVFVLLFLRFVGGYGYDVGKGLWHALFHAVSSFNNAGFALYTDNLIPFAADPFICLPICAAIILGGFGFPVLMQLRREWRHPLRWSMNTRLVLWGTALLIPVGTIYITVIEWSNPGTLGQYENPWSRLLIGFFHAVQVRTAGFNSVDVGLMHDETWVGMDVLMFIGGGPAGTAGGIKVTTFGVLLFILLTELRGEGAVNIFGKRLSRAVHRQAISVVLVAIGAVMSAVVAIMIITGLPFDRVLFEAVSAFGTVGLTTGITWEMPPSAEMILVVLMFLGRIGPLTLGSALALRDRRILYEYPKERPAIG
ncbi:TrkH family potassium uptake protein [Microbacterium thalassium]|uniref:Potassium uptake TrkH family protein n=1 Tax=Microbacterium thalassium TaxID=362649 RepID=A0A7X0FSP3_9MICO|nr:potassium transporter TrkG [Microbacterium thalassium]MBB6392976.1 potassium uptake TrkH family protein [Microbacterium thalassium]GLK22792.1 potassium transporter Trk [Microbacterium thalassium]